MNAKLRDGGLWYMCVWIRSTSSDPITLRGGWSSLEWRERGRERERLEMGISLFAHTENRPLIPSTMIIIIIMAIMILVKWPVMSFLKGKLPPTLSLSPSYSFNDCLISKWGFIATRLRRRKNQRTKKVRSFEPRKKTSIRWLLPWEGCVCECGPSDSYTFN